MNKFAITATLVPSLPLRAVAATPLERALDAAMHHVVHAVARYQIPLLQQHTAAAKSTWIMTDGQLRQILPALSESVL